MPTVISAKASGDASKIQALRLRAIAARFFKFCIVGMLGLLVDMTTLFVLADHSTLNLNVLFSKACAAELAMLNNFAWNECWTFRNQGKSSNGQHRPLFLRFIIFNGICGIGILLAIILLRLFHSLFGMGLYSSNLFAIGIVTFWNFGLNARFNWRTEEE